MSKPLRPPCSVAELRRQLEADEFLNQLSNTTLFNGITPDTLPLIVIEEMCSKIRIEPLLKNEVLKFEDRSSCLYEIRSGYVKIYDRPRLPGEKETSLKGPRMLLAWRGRGELLGEFEFTSTHNSNPDYIQATDDCQLMIVPIAVIETTAKYQPKIFLNVAASLASKTRKARARAQILQLPNSACITARLFIELLDERGLDLSITECRVIDGTIYIKDIADFLGCGEHSASEGFGAMRKKKLAKHYQSKRSGRFEICEREELVSFLETEWKKALLKQQNRQRNNRAKAKLSAKRRDRTS